MLGTTEKRSSREQTILAILLIFLALFDNKIEFWKLENLVQYLLALQKRKETIWRHKNASNYLSMFATNGRYAVLEALKTTNEFSES